MMNVAVEFRHALRAATCFQPGDPVVLGVSGGADSLAMLHLFAQVQAESGIKPHVLHLNHRIRGAEADTDAKFVAAICGEWGIPCRVAQADVPALARKQHIALEEAARQARYRALIEEAEHIGARVIAVAHNADDQAETVLMHFLRGAGLAGLRGMLPVTPLSEFSSMDFPLPPGEGLGVRESEVGLLIRPMLGIPRAEIEAYCAEHHLSPRTDSTNLDTTYFRNRLRHEVIPLLESLTPGLRERLARTAAVMTADYDLLQRDLDSAWAEMVIEDSPARIRFDRDKWSGLPGSLRRLSLRRAIARLRAGLRDVGFVHIEDAVKVAQSGSTGARATLPGGLMLYVDYGALTLSPDGDQLPAPDWPLLDPDAEIAVSAPGEVELPSGWRFRLILYKGARSGPEWQTLLADIWSAVIALSPDDATHLRLRPRRAGDRFQPQGIGGTQKVNEFMINAKIPAVWRGRIPLLVAGDRVAWLCGWRVDERFAVKPDAREVWLAKFETE